MASSPHPYAEFVHRVEKPARYTIGASGLFGNGFDLLGQLSIGGSF